MLFAVPEKPQGLYDLRRSRKDLWRRRKGRKKKLRQRKEEEDLPEKGGGRRRQSVNDGILKDFPDSETNPR
ncbi:hypothetical protein ACLB2K_068347 [Fragaria x ananassa]